MRRRFAFIELSPDEEPTKSVLAAWSAKHGLGDRAARLLARLNERIEDPEFRGMIRTVRHLVTVEEVD